MRTVSAIVPTGPNRAEDLRDRSEWFAIDSRPPLGSFPVPHRSALDLLGKIEKAE